MLVDILEAGISRSHILSVPTESLRLIRPHDANIPSQQPEKNLQNRLGMAADSFVGA